MYPFGAVDFSGCAGFEAISGPAELRRAALQSVPDWHYSPEITLPAKVHVNITFKVNEQAGPAPGFNMPIDPLGTLQRRRISGLNQPVRARCRR